MLKFVHTHRLIIGANGTGKTTLGRAFAGFLNYPYADMSRIAKIAAQFDDRLKNIFAEYSVKGQLVPDEIIMPYFDKYMATHDQGAEMIFMGVPRIKSQLVPFIKSVEEHVGLSRLTVADLQISEDSVIARCKARAEEARANGTKPRKEDCDESIIRKRFADWHTERPALVKALREYATVVEVSCEGEEQDTFWAVAEALDLTEDRFFIKPAPRGFKAGIR